MVFDEGRLLSLDLATFARRLVRPHIKHYQVFLRSEALQEMNQGGFISGGGLWDYDDDEHSVEMQYDQL